MEYYNERAATDEARDDEIDIEAVFAEAVEEEAHEAYRANREWLWLLAQLHRVRRRNDNLLDTNTMLTNQGLLIVLEHPGIGTFTP